MKILIFITLLSTSLFAFVLLDTVVGLTVLVDFPDDTFTEYNNYGSVYQYFKDVSLNKFHYKNIFAAPSIDIP